MTTKTVRDLGPLAQAREAIMLSAPACDEPASILIQYRRVVIAALDRLASVNTPGAAYRVAERTLEAKLGYVDHLLADMADAGRL